MFFSCGIVGWSKGTGLVKVVIPQICAGQFGWNLRFIWAERQFNASWNMIAFRAMLNFTMLQVGKSKNLSGYPSLGLIAW